MKKRLPINNDVIYAGMCRDRNRIITALTNPNNVTWYINNFIPILMYNTYNIHCYDTSNYYEVFDIYDKVLNINIVDNCDFNIKTMTEAIANERYVVTNWDRFYVNNTAEYGKSHLIHEALIYGYNQEEEIVYFHDSALNGEEFGFGIISFNEFESALSNIVELTNKNESKKWQAAFAHPHAVFGIKSANEDINIRKIFHELSGQIEGKRTLVIDKDAGSKEFLHGIAVFDGIGNLITQYKSNVGFDLENREIAVWSIKLLADYMLTMGEKMKYIADKGFVFGINDMTETFHNISKELMMLHNVFKKYLTFRKERDALNAEGLVIKIKAEYVELLEFIIGKFYKSLY